MGIFSQLSLVQHATVGIEELRCTGGAGETTNPAWDGARAVAISDRVSETLFPFEAHFSRQVVAQFEGGWLTTEGGALLLRQADRKIDSLRRVAGCFTDYRQQRVEHHLEEMLAQRIYGLALGYED